MKIFLTANQLHNVTVQPLRGERGRIAMEGPKQNIEHSMTLLAQRVDT
ncbi:hypothetical protein [Massilia genomosp. 1]|nr:hypothetical protein [Massilia genomosp. 1]